MIFLKDFFGHRVFFKTAKKPVPALIIPHCYEPISVHYNSSGAAAAAAAAGLTKFAEAAGKRMRKLKRTWSLKKSDISRNLRKYSAPGFPGTSGSKLAGSSGLGIRNGGARGSKRIGQGNLEIKNGICRKGLASIF